MFFIILTIILVFVSVFSFFNIIFIIVFFSIFVFTYFVLKRNLKKSCREVKQCGIITMWVNDKNWWNKTENKYFALPWSFVFKLIMASIPKAMSKSNLKTLQRFESSCPQFKVRNSTYAVATASFHFKVIFLWFVLTCWIQQVFENSSQNMLAINI